MIIVGTAGHIDHGKSSIVRRLTGTDPDRLPEEKARGMTIDLGFAFLTLPNKTELGFVDVPGHERFVKTMIAGAGGVDIAMLVVAADDGWMPQTEEHLQIIRLLGIERGIIVLNKIDLVSDLIRDERLLEIREKLHSTPLANSKIIAFSAISGSGVETLLESLSTLAAEVTRDNIDGYPRLSVDRAFVQTGIGSVATGTLRDGTLRVGETVSVWPSLAQGKIKTLQSRGHDVACALSGYRTALSLSGEARESLSRGSVVTTRPGLKQLLEMQVLALLVEVLPGTPVALEERRRVLLLSGTSEAAGEVRLLFNDEIAAGDCGIVLIKPEKPLFTLVGDPLVIRLETPMVTIGGARVLSHVSAMPRRRETANFQYLQEFSSGRISDAIQIAIHEQVIVARADVLPFSKWAQRDILVEIEALLRQKVISHFNDTVYETATVNELLSRISNEVRDILNREPHRDGVAVDHLHTVHNLKESTASLLIDYGVSVGMLRRAGKNVTLPIPIDELKGVVKQTFETLVADLKVAAYKPLSLSGLAGKGKIMQQVVKISLDRDISIKIGSEYLILSSHWEQIRHFLAEHFTTHENLSVTDLKARFGITRKFAIPILEETDRLKYTKRIGDARVRGEKLNEIYTR